MKANYKEKIPQATSEVNLGNLYDVNKQLMAREAAIDQDILKQKKEALKQWFIEHYSDKYFMLLCHECRDYTVFNLNKYNIFTTPQSNTISTVAADVIECMTNRGSLLALELQPDDVWELWIRNAEQECFVYYLFPYGTAVLEY